MKRISAVGEQPVQVAASSDALSDHEVAVTSGAVKKDVFVYASVNLRQQLSAGKGLPGGAWNTQPSNAAGQLASYLVNPCDSDLCAFNTEKPPPCDCNCPCPCDAVSPCDNIRCDADK